MIKAITLFIALTLLYGCGVVNIKNVQTSDLPDKSELKKSLKQLEKKYELIGLYSFEKINNNANTYPFDVNSLINSWGEPDNIYKIPNNKADYIKPNLYCGIAALIPGAQAEAVLCFAGVNGLVYGSHKYNKKQTFTWFISNKIIKVYTNEKETTHGVLRVVNDWEWCEQTGNNNKYYYSDGEKCI